MAPSIFIKASEVREYVFCPRSWARFNFRSHSYFLLTLDIGFGLRVHKISK